MAEYFKRVKEMTDQEAGSSFKEKILSMCIKKIVTDRSMVTYSYYVALCPSFTNGLLKLSPNRRHGWLVD